MADPNGTIPATATVGDIRLPFGQQDPAMATSLVELGNNLDASVTRSEASLTPGTTPTNGINSVTGLARDGAGGTHAITIVGNQAVQANRAGANLAALVLTGVEVLGADLGVTDTTFSLSVDGGPAISISGLTLNSTINDLVNAIDGVDGVDASLVSGEVVITRFKAGVSYTVETNTAVAGDIVNRVLGVGAGSTLNVNNGTDHDFVVTDVFTPSFGVTTPVTTELSISISTATGLATGVTGLGGGGVTISSGDAGLTAGTASITTTQTEKATSITVYDSLGGTHTMMVNFIKLHESNKWGWEISMTGGEQVQSGYTGTITFGNNGSLLNFSYDGGADCFAFDPNNGAGVSEIDLFAGTIGAFDGLTGFAGTETVAAINQDGYGMGILDSISIDPTGLIIGKFTNGVSRNLAQLVLADFSNEGGLTKVGESLFQTSANSGAAIEGVAGETVSATISSGALESANVDLAQEFTAMIIAQRGFQSNARVITTSDNMLDELVNLKR